MLKFYQFYLKGCFMQISRKLFLLVLSVAAFSQMNAMLDGEGQSEIEILKKKIAEEGQRHQEENEKKEQVDSKISFIKQICDAEQANNHEKKIVLIKENLKEFDKANADATKNDLPEIAKKIVCDKEIAEAGIEHFKKYWFKPVVSAGVACAASILIFGFWLGRVTKR